jgi:hypothetical protein
MKALKITYHLSLITYHLSLITYNSSILRRVLSKKNDFYAHLY